MRIGAADLDDATRAYTLLLRVTAQVTADGSRRFQLGRGAVEIAAGTPGLHAICFTPNAPDAPPLPASLSGVPLRLCPARAPSAELPGAIARAIDHVVVQTLAPERVIAFWRDRAGLRLALDRRFPERGLRLLFFRSGSITLEYASPDPPALGPDDAVDRFHGLSYRVTDLPAHRDRLAAAGVDVSALRPGMRPGTRVVTVRSGTAGVPTLLLDVA